MPAPGKAPATWKTQANGIKAQHLWETTPRDWPQITLLKLSNDLYQEFVKDPSAFATKQNIFGKAVQNGSRCVLLANPPEGYTGDWNVTLVHHNSSGMACSSSPAPKEP